MTETIKIWEARKKPLSLGLGNLDLACSNCDTTFMSVTVLKPTTIQIIHTCKECGKILNTRLAFKG